VAAQENKLILVTGLAAGQVVETPLARELLGLEAIAWSGDGSTAILFSRTENWVRILSGLPASPNLGSRIDISPSGSISSAAVDATGQTLAIAVTGTHSGVYQLANGGALVPMLPLANPQALAFSSDGTQLYALDQATHQLSQITISGLSTLTWPLAGMTNPVAIGSGRDAQNRSVVYVAGGVDQLLYVYDPATQTLLTSLSLPFQPSSLEVLGRGSFVLAARSANDDPLWSFAIAPRLQVSFIPASPLPSGKPQPRGSLVP
jgi:sugar lactone lactonase YvrE